MKILVYDSGISETQRKFIKTVDIGFGVTDEANHGSVVCDIIKLLSPASEIESIKILDSDNSTTLDVLMDSLELGMDSDCDIICLALSVEYENDCPPLKEMMEKFDRSGKIVVCSNMNKKEYSLPAAYESVIGCMIQYNSPDKRLYVKGRSIQSSIPVLAVWRMIEEARFIRLTGNSLSCAVMAGEIAYISHIKNIKLREDIENYLADMEWKDYRFPLHSSVYNATVDNEMLIYIYDKIQMVMKKYTTDIKRPLYMSENIEMILGELYSCGLLAGKNMILHPPDLESIETLARFICNTTETGVKYEL